MELIASYSDPVYTGSGSSRVGATTVTLTFILSDGSTVIKTETFDGIKETTEKDFEYTTGDYDITVAVTVIAEGVNNSMIITSVDAGITDKILNK